jgi:hypothetical protein
MQLRNALIRSSAVLLVLFSSLTAAGAASAEDRRVRIINETNFTITHFYGSNVGEDDWQEDILGQDVLPPGESVVINFDDGSGYCKFDFKAKFEDNDEVIKNNIDVCEISSFRFTE